MSWEDEGYGANPIHFVEGVGWFFWDETWSYAHGPYDTEMGAQDALRRYALTLENDQEQCCGHRAVGHYGI